MAKNNISKCSICKRKIPTELLAPIFTLIGISRPMCGICALELRNSLQGTNDKKFQGERAEENRLEAIKYYKKTKQK